MLLTPCEVPPGSIVVEAPVWLQAIPSEPAISSADGESLLPSTLSASAEIARATGLASALETAKTPVVYTVNTLVDSGLAQDVVDGMTKIVEEMAGAHGMFLRLMPNSRNRYLIEWFLAVWPDLGPMIAKGHVTPRIVRIPDGPEGARIPRTSCWTYSPTTKMTELSINTHNGWQIQMVFSDINNPQPDLYALVTAVKEH